MKHVFILSVVCLVALSCSTQKAAKSGGAYNGSTAIVSSNNMPQSTNGEPFDIVIKSTDENYGTAKDPIKVGGALESKGPLNERRFLNALAGPNGEEITYKRQGACCPFETPNSSFGGMLDVYAITWEGQTTPLKLYINM
jgi:hypothetical protein